MQLNLYVCVYVCVCVREKFQDDQRLAYEYCQRREEEINFTQTIDAFKGKEKSQGSFSACCWNKLGKSNF